MNERIKDLLKQATRELNPDDRVWVFSKVDQNKFAELIVRECIFMIENAENGYQDYRNQIENGMRNHCISLIKNKFGIKE